MREGAQVVVEMLERVGRRKGNQVAKCGAVASADPGKSQRKTYTRDKSLMSWIAVWSLPKPFRLRKKSRVSLYENRINGDEGKRKNMKVGDLTCSLSSFGEFLLPTPADVAQCTICSKPHSPN